MCLITFNWIDHPVYRLVLVANRDEYFNRPTANLHRWATGMYAGKDLKAGGTWLGIHPNGRFAALTNFRDMPNEREGRNSRGDLIPRFITGKQSVLDYVAALQEEKHRFNGFSLLVADGTDMWYVSNYQADPEQVTPGIHGLSNALLNTPWAKVEQAKKDLERLVSNSAIGLDELEGLLLSREYAADGILPSTGLEKQLERAVSAQFIRVDDYYGTVNTTAVLIKHNGEVELREQRYIPENIRTQVAFRMEPVLVD